MYLSRDLLCFAVPFSTPLIDPFLNGCRSTDLWADLPLYSTEQFQDLRYSCLMYVGCEGLEPPTRWLREITGRWFGFTPVITLSVSHTWSLTQDYIWKRGFLILKRTGNGQPKVCTFCSQGYFGPTTWGKMHTQSALPLLLEDGNSCNQVSPQAGICAYWGSAYIREEEPEPL